MSNVILTKKLRVENGPNCYDLPIGTIMRHVPEDDGLDCICAELPLEFNPIDYGTHVLYVPYTGIPLFAGQYVFIG